MTLTYKWKIVTVAVVLIRLCFVYQYRFAHGCGHSFMKCIILDKSTRSMNGRSRERSNTGNNETETDKNNCGYGSVACCLTVPRERKTCDMPQSTGLATAAQVARISPCFNFLPMAVSDNKRKDRNQWRLGGPYPKFSKTECIRDSEETLVTN